MFVYKIFTTHLFFAVSLIISVHAQQQESNTTTINTILPWTSWSTAGLNDIEAINQVLNLDPIAVDTKTWSLLSQIYTPDITASYSANSPTVSGLDALQAALSKAVTNFTSQHLLGTRLVNISDDAQTANATTYAQATLFKYPQTSSDQVVFLYGFYNDKLVKSSSSSNQSDSGDGDAGGGWRVQDRVFRLIEPGVAGNTLLFG